MNRWIGGVFFDFLLVSARFHMIAEAKWALSLLVFRMGVARLRIFFKNVIFLPSGHSHRHFGMSVEDSTDSCQRIAFYWYSDQ